MRKREAYEIESQIGHALNLIEKNENAMTGVGGSMAKAVFGFNSSIGRVAPDAWYLPEDRHNPAIIATCVLPTVDITKADCYSEKILRTCLNMFTSPGNYDKMVGILFNGEIARVFKADGSTIVEVPDMANLQPREVYLNLWN